jgi:sodium/bile acid cotransporter 7
MPLVERLPRNGLVASVLLAMGLTLRTDAIRAVLNRPLPTVLGVGVNMVLLPLLAWAMSPLLSGQLRSGFLVAAAVPCTIASAAVWTRRAGGNDAIALSVTLITNLGCFLATPAWLRWTAGHGTQMAGDFGPMATKLALLVVLPILLAQSLRTVGFVSSWAARHKQELGVYCQLGILTMVLIGAVHSGATIAHLADGWKLLAGEGALMLVLVTLLHLAAWLLAYWLAGKLGLTPAEGLAVAFSGSQKTLMVGLAVALDFGGLAVLPLIAYHAIQLLVDTVLADRYRIADAAPE